MILTIAFALITTIVALLAAVLVTVPLDWGGQLLLASGVFVAAMLLNRIHGSRLVTIAMIGLSLFITARYGYWRATETLGIGSPEYAWINLVPTLLLFLAELYAIGVLVLGYLQTVWPLGRKPTPLTDDVSQWPSVDVFIPTYNEPLDVVRPTVLASLQMDWPADRLNIYLLDDGRRDEFRAFAESAGVHYVTRPDNKHAKAGNLNHAIRVTSGKYIAIFDCDHVPVRSFLQLTVGVLEADPQVALVQTPHHFYSPDPFERNLKLFKKVPNEGELFYGIVQDGNDLWDASFFCGSCAVLRREALEQIGGIAVETVTEDAHTSLKLHALGWKSAYIGVPQAAGLATENLAGHIGQRIRWARGMVQIFRTDNPLFKRGLKFGQRLCYLNAMLHFMNAAPRLIFLTAPLFFLLLDLRIIDAFALTFAVYALPHLFLAQYVNSRIQGKHRFTFWNEVYETALAPYILIPTLMALINPKLGKFNVTAKGGQIDKNHFDTGIAWPYAVLWLLNLAGLFAFGWRYFTEPDIEIWTLIITGFWTLYNFLIISVVIAVARESRQVRRSVRIPVQLPAQIHSKNAVYPAVTADISTEGIRLRLIDETQLSPPPGEILIVSLSVDTETFNFPCEVVGSHDGELRMRFTLMDEQQQLQLVRVLYTRADAWIGWGQAPYEDRPLRSFFQITGIALRGTAIMLRSLLHPGAWLRRRAIVQGVLALALIPLFGAPHLAQAQPTGPDSGDDAAANESGVASETPPVLTPRALDDLTRPLLRAAANDSPLDRVLARPIVWRGDAPSVAGLPMSLRDHGRNEGMLLTGVARRGTIPVSIPVDEQVERAQLTLTYVRSPHVWAQRSHLNVLVNDAVIATLPFDREPAIEHAATLTLDIDPRFFTRHSTLGFELIARTDDECYDLADPVIWTLIHPETTLDLDVRRVALPPAFSRLPAPFIDTRWDLSIDVPFVLGARDVETLTAAGILTSWFGAAMPPGRPLRFPVVESGTPRSHLVVVDASGDWARRLGVDRVDGPTVAIRPHPADATYHVLAILGRDAADLRVAAAALASGTIRGSGNTARVTNFTWPDSRPAGRAPRWLPTDRPVRVDEIAEARELQVNQRGYASIPAYLPPDLFWWGRDGALGHFEIRYNPTPIGPLSSVSMTTNGLYTGATALPGRRGLDDAARDDTRSREFRVVVPPGQLQPYANQFDFYFDFQPPETDACGDKLPDNQRGIVSGDSTIDLGGVPRYVRLPDLARFANGSLPHSRHDDLSDTVAVLADTPSSGMIAGFLGVLGHIGQQTGAPALRLTVVGAEDRQSIGDRHVLWFADASGLPADLEGRLPVHLDGERRTVHDLRTHWHHLRNRLPWWDHDTRWQINNTQLGRLTTTGDNLTLIQQGVSPWGDSRLITVFYAENDHGWRSLVNALVDTRARPGIFGDITIIDPDNGDRHGSFVMDAPRVYLGELDWLTWVRWQLSRFGLSMLPILLALALLQAVVAWLWFRRRAQQRVQPNPSA